MTSAHQKTTSIFLTFFVSLMALSFVAANNCSAADFAGNLKSVSITDSSGANQPPTAVIKYTHNGDTYTFDASGSSDTDGSIVDYKWDFGDLNTGSGSLVTHKFTTIGSYPVSLTVIDKRGSVALEQLIVSISPPAKCVGGGTLTDCTPLTVPDHIFSTNKDRTTVFKWSPSENGTVNRVKIYFGTPLNGTWANFSNVYVVVLKGVKIVATATINPVNNAWVWSDVLQVKAGQDLNFDTADEIYFGLTVDAPIDNLTSYSFGYFDEVNSPSFFYRNIYMAEGGGWGVYHDRQMGAILEYFAQ